MLDKFGKPGVKFMMQFSLLETTLAYLMCIVAFQEGKVCSFPLNVFNYHILTWKKIVQNTCSLGDYLRNVLDFPGLPAMRKTE